MYATYCVTTNAATIGFDWILDNGASYTSNTSAATTQDVVCGYGLTVERERWFINSAVIADITTVIFHKFFWTIADNV